MSSPLDDGLAGLRVLVTGAAGGIGSAVVEAFVEAGAAVVASDLVPPTTPGTRADLAVDITDTEDCVGLVREASDMLGGLDAIAHTAGVLRRREHLTDVTEADWDLQHEVNLRASFFLLREGAELMKAQGIGGRLVALASQSWQTGGYGGSAVYAATKGGLVSLCRGMARTYGPFGITVNTVAPGAIDTAMLTTDLSQEALDATLAATPLGRLGTPAEVASTVLFLASSRASFVTAATLNVSGGWLAY